VVRSLLDEKRFPTPSGLFDIGKLGGWSKVNDDLFDPDEGKVAKIFQKQGKSTGAG
jgi:ABC-type sulfate transport system substrate-binding protein